jgi:hypothetical protein
MVFCGSFVSSANVEIASNPRYAKTIKDAAVQTPFHPYGKKSEVIFSNFTYLIPTMIKTIKIANLSITIAAFTFALSLIPIVSKTKTPITPKKANRSITVPLLGSKAPVSSTGRVNPKFFSKKVRRYPDQPVATAAVATPYSSKIFQATSQAIISPSVAYV